MATKEELSEQLALTQKLAMAVEQMSKAMEKVESSYDTQIAAVEKLTKAIEQLKGKDLGSLNQTKLDGFLKEFKTAGNETKSLSKHFTDLGKNVAKKFPTSVAIGISALSGFHQGIRNVLALGKGVAGFFSSFVDGATNIAASIIAIPFKMFTALVDMAAGVSGGMDELAVAVERVRKEFGDLKGPATKAIFETTKTLKGFSDTGLSSFTIFGTIAERLEHVTKIASSMGATFGVVRKEFEQNGGALLAFEKGLDGSGEGMRQIAERAITMGKPMTRVFMDMTKQTLALGKAFDIDQKIIGKDMVKALSDVKHFGAVTVKEIGQASVYARKLGLELDKITGTLDAFETFDSAAENSAKLSQSFGVTIDAFKMMDSQNPAESLDMLRKSFREAGIDSSKFTRQQAKLLAQTTGLEEATVRQAFSASNYGVSLDKVKKQSDAAEKKTMTQAEAMGKLADSIERMIKSGGGQEGGFWKQFVSGFLGGIQASGEFRDIIWNIKRSLHETYLAGVRLGKAFLEMFPGVKSFLQGISDFFKPEKFKKLTNGVVDVIKVWMKDLAESGGKASFPDLMKKIREKFFSFFDGQSSSNKKMIDGFKTTFKTVATVLGEAIKWMADNVAEGIVFVTDLLTGKKKVDTSGVKGGLGFLGQVLMPLFEGLKHAWKVIAPALLNLVLTVGKLMYQFFTSEKFLSIVKPMLPYIAGALFGPVLMRSLLGAITTSLIKGAPAIIKQFGSILPRILGSAAGPVAIAAAAISVGEGVNKYTDEITSVMDRNSKVISAGATGIIDALTLGLLPKDFSLKIANTLASVVDQLFKGLKKHLGIGFADSLKRQLAAQFEFIGSLWNFLKSAFMGKPEETEEAGKELFLAAARFAMTTFERIFIQIPLFIVKMGSKVAENLAGLWVDIIVLPFTGAIQGLLKVARKIPGPIGELAGKVEDGFIGIKDKIKKAIVSVANTAGTGAEAIGTEISSASKTIQDELLRTEKQKQKMAVNAAASAGATQGEMAKVATQEAVSSIENVKKNIEVVKDVQKTLEDKTFDLPAVITAVKAKLAGVNFDLVSETQAKSLETSVKSSAMLASFASSFKDAVTVISSLSSLKGTGNIDAKALDMSALSKVVSASETSVATLTTALGKAGDTKALNEKLESYVTLMKTASTALKTDGLAKGLTAAADMVKLANQLDEALSGGVKIDLPAKLTKLASGVGLGGKFNYTVKSKDVVINLNLSVYMNVDEVEKVMIMRKSSIIRDRLNFATGDGHGERGTPNIPEKYQAILQNINKGP